MYSYDYDLKTEDLRGVKSIKRVLVWEYENALKQIDDIPKTIYMIAALPLLSIFAEFFMRGIAGTSTLIQVFIQLNFFVVLGYMARKRSLNVVIIALVGYIIWLIMLFQWMPLIVGLMANFKTIIVVVLLICVFIWLLFRLIQGIYYFRVFEKAKIKIIDILNQEFKN